MIFFLNIGRSILINRWLFSNQLPNFHCFQYWNSLVVLSTSHLIIVFIFNFQIMFYLNVLMLTGS